MTTVTVTFIVDDMPENHAQALHALGEYIKGAVHCSEPQDLTVTGVNVTLPTLYTLIGLYPGKEPAWTETIPGRTLQEAIALAPKDVRVIAAIENTDDNEVMLVSDLETGE